MIFRLVWLKEAESDIARIFMHAPATERPAITAAIYAARDTLQTTPNEVGESRAGSRRVVFQTPLVITYDVDSDRRIVWIAAVGQTRGQDPA